MNTEHENLAFVFNDRLVVAHKVKAEGFLHKAEELWGRQDCG